MTSEGIKFLKNNTELSLSFLIQFFITEYSGENVTMNLNFLSIVIISIINLIIINEAICVGKKRFGKIREARLQFTGTGRFKTPAA